MLKPFSCLSGKFGTQSQINREINQNIRINCGSEGRAGEREREGPDGIIMPGTRRQEPT